MKSYYTSDSESSHFDSVFKVNGDAKTKSLRFAKGKLLPLFKTKSIPYWHRLTIPLVIIFDIFLFVQNNWYEGAFINMSFKAGIIYIPPTTLSDFNLIQSIEDMWKAKVYPLAILIAAASLIWPYVKLLGNNIIFFVFVIKTARF
jgi:hypothetical protein